MIEKEKSDKLALLINEHILTHIHTQTHKRHEHTFAQTHTQTNNEHLYTRSHTHKHKHTLTS